MFSFGVVHPILFSIAEPFSKGKQTPIWQSEKRSTFWPENNEFFKSNMDAMTALSIWNTGMYFVLLPSVDLDLPHAIDYDVEDG